jgi:uncharacterized protein
LAEGSRKGEQRRLRRGTKIRAVAALSSRSRPSSPSFDCEAQDGNRPLAPLCLSHQYAAEDNMATDERSRVELEAAVFRRLVEHLRSRTDVQNIDLMNLAGFCRNCLSNWMKEAADTQGVPMSKEQSRELVYGMPYDEWRSKYQKDSSAEQKAAFEKASQKH